MTDKLNKAELRRLAEAMNATGGESYPAYREVFEQFIEVADADAILSLLDENDRFASALQASADLAASSRSGPAQSESLRIIEEISAKAVEHRDGRLFALERAVSAEAERDQLRVEVEALRQDAERWRFVRSPIGSRSPYAVWHEGRSPVFSAIADACIDEEIAKEGSA